MSTAAFPLAVWAPNTLQNSIPANDNALRTEMLIARVNSATTTAQPGSPANGDIYIIPSGKTGTQWATFTIGDLAVYYSGTWYAMAPGTAFKIARVVDTGALLAWNGTAWVNFETLLGAKGTDVASAATTNLATATGWFVHVTGTTTITALGTAKAGTPRWVRFAGALTLTHNATSLILPGGANITTAANDVALFISEGSGNWRCAFYQRADGSSVYPYAPLASPTFTGTPAAPTAAVGTDTTQLATTAYVQREFNPRYCFEVLTDFASANLASVGPDLSRTVSGTGASVTADIGTATQPGFAECFLGTTTTGRVGFGTYPRALKLGGGALRSITKAALSNLSDGTNTFTQWLGLSSSYGSEGTDLVCFRYTHSVNSGKWQAVTSASGVQTATDTGVTVVAGAEKVFDIRVNAAGTEVTFYIDGVLVATHSTNIPTGEMGAMVNTIRSAGTADIVSLNIDLLYCRIDFTTPRW